MNGTEVEVTAESRNFVYGNVSYTLLYNKEKNTFSCTCIGNSAYLKECKHIREFKRKIKDKIPQT